MTNSAPKVLILGAGFAGVKTALSLCKTLPRHSITLVNNKPYHCFTPDLYEVSTAIVQKEKKVDFNNLKSTTNIPLNQIFKNSGIEVVVDTVKLVNLDVKVVALQSGDLLHFDYLVIALGSTVNYFGIAGAETFGHPLKTTEDAINIRNDMDELISSSSRPANIVIGGGGFAGVELAAELAGYIKNITKLHNKTLANISIVQSSAVLLPEMPIWAQETAHNRLQKLGIEILTNNRIKEVDKEHIYCENGKKVFYDYLIWTTGIKGSSLNIKGAEITKRGQITVTENLNLTNYQNVFAVGDFAECWDKKRDCPVPQTAWAAISQAKIVSQNISLALAKKPMLSYWPPNPFFIVPLGQKHAISNIVNFKAKGITVWVLKRLVSLNYLLSILSPIDALTIWTKGVKIYISND